MSGALFQKIQSDEDWAIKYILATKGRPRGWGEKEIIINQNTAIQNNQLNIESNLHEILERARQRWNSQKKMIN